MLRCSLVCTGTLGVTTTARYYGQLQPADLAELLGAEPAEALHGRLTQSGVVDAARVVRPDVQDADITAPSPASTIPK